MELNLHINVEIKDLDTEDAIAMIHYPNEGNTITITKGLNVVELSEAIFHEIGHLIDWYVSNQNQSKNIDIREQNANIIGESLRFRQPSHFEPMIISSPINELDIALLALEKSHNTKCVILGVNDIQQPKPKIENLVLMNVKEVHQMLSIRNDSLAVPFIESPHKIQKQNSQQGWKRKPLHKR